MNPKADRESATCRSVGLCLPTADPFSQPALTPSLGLAAFLIAAVALAILGDLFRLLTAIHRQRAAYIILGVFELALLAIGRNVCRVSAARSGLVAWQSFPTTGRS